MAKKETVFVCSSCGNEFSKWAGQCSACMASLQKDSNDILIKNNYRNHPDLKSKSTSFNPVETRRRHVSTWLSTIYHLRSKKLVYYPPLEFNIFVDGSVEADDERAGGFGYYLKVLIFATFDNADVDLRFIGNLGIIYGNFFGVGGESIGT